MTTCDIVLRVRLREGNYESALQMIDPEDLDATWRAGDPRLGGAIHDSFGANVILAQDVDLRTLERAGLKAVGERSIMISSLARLGAQMEIDIGIYADRPATSLSLSPAFLHELVVHELSVRCSFYASE